MGFAERYLQKHAIGQPLIQAAPDPNIHSIIAIPAYNESRLRRCLDSLLSCDPPDRPVEVIVLINSGSHTPRAIIDLNRKAHRELVAWCSTHQRPGLAFHPLLLEDLPMKHFGAGLARKLVMDEAVRRFNQLDHAAGIILSLDGDTTVEENYLREVNSLFDRSPQTDGCSIRFAHPLEAGRDTPGPEDPETGGLENEGTGGLENAGTGGLEDPKTGASENPETGASEDPGTGAPEDPETGDAYPAAVYDAIVNYELHQRYYLEAVRFTGYPYAYHTVGSAFAVRAGAYCRQGGMSKRQAGEDFYFIQKIAMQGNYTECNTTTVHPSPRPSDRVPFGTGPAVARQLEAPDVPYRTYAPELFLHLQAFYSLVPDIYSLLAGPTATGPTLHPSPGSQSTDKTDQEGALPNHASSRSHSIHDTDQGSNPPNHASSRSHSMDTPGQGSDLPIHTQLASLPDVLQRYLETTGFRSSLTEIHGNVASEAAFRQRFLKKFNMFWILKYIHFAEEQGVDKVDVGNAARKMLEMKGEAVTAEASSRELLAIYRNKQAG